MCYIQLKEGIAPSQHHIIQWVPEAIEKRGFALRTSTSL